MISLTQIFFHTVQVEKECGSASYFWWMLKFYDGKLSPQGQCFTHNFKREAFELEANEIEKERLTRVDMKVISFILFFAFLYSICMRLFH
jgi:hypothetical protein